MSLRPNRRIWFHGTHADFEEFSHDFSFRTGDLNTRLGFHFAASLDTAWNFATWLYRKAEAPKTGYVLACQLDLRNPKAFEDEKHLAHYVRSVGIAAGVLPEDILVSEEMLKWTANAKGMYSSFLSYYASEYWPALSKAVEKLGKGQELAQVVIAKLTAEGHDGLIYGNTNEKEVTRYRERTAVCFQASQVEVLGKAKVDVQDEFLPRFANWEKSGGIWRRKPAEPEGVEAARSESFELA